MNKQRHKKLVLSILIAFIKMLKMFHSLKPWTLVQHNKKHDRKILLIYIAFL